MPRAARIKNSTAIYHTTSRSITEFNLFPDKSDKEYFLDLLQKYKEKYHCRIYGYCLMSTHYHLIVDTCGYDISKFMKGLNQTHVNYINKKYKRRGHLLTERFYSKVIDSSEYMLTASAYVHNNPKDLPEYNGKEFDYPYSSMGIYLNKRKDKRNLVDTDFLLGCVDENDKNKARMAYAKMVIERRNIDTNEKLRKYIDEFLKEQFVYKSYRIVFLRDKKPEEVIKALAEKFGMSDGSELMHRWKRKTMEFRSVVAYALNVFCGMGTKEICKYMYNITPSCCSKLCDKGFEIVQRNSEIKSFLLGLAAS